MRQSSDSNIRLTDTAATTSEVSAVLSGDQLSQARARERLKVLNTILSLLLSLVFLTLFIVTGASSALRDALGGNALLPTLAFVLVFQLILTLLDFPLELYFGFVQGKRFGLLKQSFGSWLVDNLKGVAVSTIISSALFLGLYTIFRSFPDLWFPFSLGLIAALFGAMLFLAPKLARLNHKSSPIEDANLEGRIKAIFARAGVRLSKVSKLHVSAKTKGMNAMLSPDGVGTEVIITDTLLEKVAPEGVEVVLAHELGHKVHRDVPVLVVMSATQIIVVIAVAQWLFGNLGTQFGLQGAGDIATLPLLLLSFTLIGQLASLLINAYKRRMEYRADAYALRITQNQPAFEAAFRVLASENLTDPDPPHWVEIWLHDHPSIDKRLEAARAWKPA